MGILNRSLDTLLGALVKRKDVINLTGVSNNAGAGDSGLGAPCVHLSLALDVHPWWQVSF
jgi:acyl CoA:acetate/3-ketoacid CoA transferase alpha subunit